MYIKLDEYPRSGMECLDAPKQGLQLRFGADRLSLLSDSKGA